MGKFDKVSSSAKKVAKKEAVKSNVPTTSVNILLEDLSFDPNNAEDTSHTEDLEYSIKRFGFRGNIEVTDFGCKKGKYRILSGHRRYVALKNLGYESAPCLIYQFEREEEVLDYNQCMNNAARDSAKDPLLWINRFNTNRRVLLAENPKMKEGDITKELVVRLGLSKPQIERIRSLTKVIPTALELAREGKVGIYSLVPLAPLKEADQNEIYNILMDALAEQGDDEETLTRPLVRDIVNAYKDGITSWEAYKESKATATVQVSPAPVSEEYTMTAEEEESAIQALQDVINETKAAVEEEDEDDVSQYDDDKDDTYGEAKEVRQGKAILGICNKLEMALHEPFALHDDASKITSIRLMGKLAESLISAMNTMANDTTDGGWDTFMNARKGINDILKKTKN